MKIRPALASILLLASSGSALAQLGPQAIGSTGSAKAPIQICVQDATGQAVAGARIHSAAARLDTTTDNTGCASLNAPTSAIVEVTHAGFATARQLLTVPGTLTVVLRPAEVQQTVQVTAARTPLALDASASSVRLLSAQQLQESPGFTLDDQLRQVAGFQLFRRTSSWVANPTTEGIALRGLGSTAASRTLVLDDQIPLNDAFGGWIHWNEIPSLALRNVELMRGGASDLYGSSAIGGVIETITQKPAQPFAYGLDLAGATEATSSVNGIASGTRGPWGALVATSLFRTGGYILTAPAFRGPVDIPSNVHSQSGRLDLRRAFLSDGSAFLRGNLLNEARSNGTVAQTNATRIWRYTAGADWTQDPIGHLLLRAYGNDQGYRQSFSTITPTRSSEKLSRFQRVPSQQFGGVAQWARGYRSLTFVAGADLLDTRGRDAETPVTATGFFSPTVNISARQRATGGYGEVLWNHGQWSAALSGRADNFRSFDAHTATGTAASTALPVISETVFDPRLGIVRQLGAGLSLTASVFRAFRGPTLNELYRTGQVGQQITQANPNLRSERATGFEFGGLLQRSRASSVRASYFWTQVNRPVAAITLSSTATSLLQRRQNLGQLESRGVTAEWELHPLSSIALTGGYQFAVSTVTRFQVNPTLVGKWTAQVPRNTATAQFRWQRPRYGVVSLDLRNSGRQYDDSANVYELHSYFLANVYVEHALRENLSLYASVQNLLDRQIQAGRTPILTLGTPRTILVGIRLH